VTALARAVFAERESSSSKATSLTLLLAMVAGEYQEQRFAEGAARTTGTLHRPFAYIATTADRSAKARMRTCSNAYTWSTSQVIRGGTSSVALDRLNAEPDASSASAEER
jgi:hypothetical protein